VKFAKANTKKEESFQEGKTKKKKFEFFAFCLLTDVIFYSFVSSRSFTKLFKAFFRRPFYAFGQFTGHLLLTATVGYFMSKKVKKTQKFVLLGAANDFDSAENSPIFTFRWFPFSFASMRSTSKSFFPHETFSSHSSTLSLSLLPTDSASNRLQIASKISHQQFKNGGASAGFSTMKELLILAQAHLTQSFPRSHKRRERGSRK
jgi:hypothetical protein